jgi:hypothetical protein
VKYSARLSLRAFLPVDEKVSLLDAVADPVKTHIHGFGSALFDCFVADAGGAGIVGLDGSGRLGIAHVCESGSKHRRFFAIEEEGAEFGFGGRGKDGGHHGGMYVNCAIGWRRCGVGVGREEGIEERVTEEEETAGPRSGVFFGEIGGVTVDM